MQHLLMSYGILFPYAVMRTHPDGSSSQGYELQLLLDPIFPMPIAPKLIAAAHQFDPYLLIVEQAMRPYRDGVTFQLSREPPEPHPDVALMQGIFKALGPEGVDPQTKAILELGCGTFERLDDLRFQRLKRIVDGEERFAGISETI